MLLILFCLNCFCFDHWEPFQVSSHVPLLFFFFFSSFHILILLLFEHFTSWYKNVFQVHLYFSAPSLGSVISSRSPSSIRNQDLDTGCAHCSWGVTASSSQQTESGDMCMNNKTCMHTYLYFGICWSVSVLN